MKCHLWLYDVVSLMNMKWTAKHGCEKSSCSLLREGQVLTNIGCAITNGYGMGYWFSDRAFHTL